MADLSNGPAGGLTGWLTMQEGLSPVIDRNARLGAYLRDQPLIQAQQQAQTQGQLGQNEAQAFQNVNAPTMMQAKLQGTPFEQQQFAQTARQQAIQTQMAQQNAQRQFLLEQETMKRNAEFSRHNMQMENLAAQKEALAQSTQDPFGLSGLGGPQGQNTQPGQTTSQGQPTPQGQAAPSQAPVGNVRAAMADPNLQGEDFLKTIPIPAQAMVKAMVEGRQAPPTGMAMKAPFWNTMIQLANKYDPTFDQTIWGARAQTRKSFSPGGKDMANLNSMNTVIGHMGTLLQAGDALKNGDIQGINSFVNSVANYFGSPKITNFETAKNAVGNDLNRVFQQSGVGSEKEIKAWKDSFSSANSPAQLHGAIQTASELLDSRIQTLNQAYAQGMGKQRDVLQMIYPHSRAALDAIKHAASGEVQQTNPGPSSDWMDRAIKANPGMSQEDIIAQGKALGKL